MLLNDTVGRMTITRLSSSLVSKKSSQFKRFRRLRRGFCLDQRSEGLGIMAHTGGTSVAVSTTPQTWTMGFGFELYDR
ncbi:hypothetical protein VTN96DRAFT_6711 [Rasamsonia emersonii]